MARAAILISAVVLVACSSISPTSSPSAPPPASLTPPPTSTPVAFSSALYLKLRAAGTVSGAPLGYIEYAPPSVGDGTAPLLVFFHGSEESGDGDESSLSSLFATGIPRVLENNAWPEDRPFIVLMPQFGPTSSHCTDSGQINDFLQFAIDYYPVDRTRVYLTGLSCGAFGTWDYLGEHTNELVAAAVPIAGDGHYAFDTAGCDLGRVPIWAIHGGADRNVDPSGSEDPIEALNSCVDPPPVDARINVYPGVGHAIWQSFYDGTKKGVDIYAWLLQYTNPAD